MAAGLTRKMKSRIGNPVDYTLILGNEQVPMNQFIGQSFGLRFTGEFTCVLCGRPMKKASPQGTCYPCFRNAPESSPCIINPELCEGHLGKGRDVQWEQDHHVQPHIVYLSYTGAVKVGVTRATQVPTRWIDQGASMAVPIARVPYRRLAGEIEVALKEHFSDKTNWRHMIKGVDADLSELEEASAIIEDVLASDLSQYVVYEDPINIRYPGEVNIPQVKSIKMDKVGEINATLVGIRGQYLVWADGRVLNIRNHSGYHLEII